MRLRAILLPVLLLLARAATATHIIGGTMYYDHLGGDQYLVTLVLYRDCGATNTQGTGFDFSAPVGVFNAAGQWLFTTQLQDPGEQLLPIVIDNPCLAAPPTVCVATTSYSGIFTLPPIPGGYHLSYQRCCRTPAIVNLNQPNQQGVTCTIQIPGPPNHVNSSPRFTGYPPVVLCMLENMVIDHSATDPDGDQLVYDLFAPFQGATNVAPAPADPSPPPYQQVVWGAGYSAAAPLNSAPPIAIDPVTGVLTVTPTLMGSFTVGVRVREYRNGVQLSEVIRDLKFDVVSCEQPIEAVIVEDDPDLQFNCLTASFANASVNADFFFWDFGDPNTLADTSSAFSPQWTYAQSGTYTVTLVANPGWTCADTAQMTITTPDPPGMPFTGPAATCVDQEVQFQGQGALPPGATLLWQLPGDASTQDLASTVLNVSFSEPGMHILTLVLTNADCTSSHSDSIAVLPPPVADFTSDEQACIGQQFTFENLSAAETAMDFFWEFGDGSTSSEAFPVHQYMEPGTYTVSLTASTTEGCVASTTLVLPAQVTVHPRPVAGFRVMPSTVSLMDPRVEVLDHAQDAISWTYLLEGQQVFDPDFTHIFDGEGHVTVWQFVTSEHGCVDSTSVDVFITGHFFYAPNAFTPNGDGLNDTFAPVVKGARLYELIIFDRYGAELFSSRDPQAEWSGDDLPQGVYTYVVRIAEFGTHRQLYRGHVSLLR
jgi:gliding motility-associated-like protein